MFKWLARIVQRRRVARCERFGGSAGTPGVCQHPEDHYPVWCIHIPLS